MGRLICEACTFIDVREVKRRGLLCAGRTFTWSWDRDGEFFGSISVRVETDSAILSFRSQIPGTARWRQSEQRIPIVWTNCHLGGRRPWSRSGISRKSPVKLPPRRARLLTHPFATGSLSRSMPTVGIVSVSFNTARIAYGAAATITLHLRATSSRANSSIRSSEP
jgi:hypothetical protein